MNKTAEQLGVASLVTIGTLLLIIIIGVSIGAEIANDVGSQNCAAGGYWNETAQRCYNTSGVYEASRQTPATNVTYEGVQGLTTIGSWFPTLTLVLMAAIVISVLVGSFALKWE